MDTSKRCSEQVPEPYIIEELERLRREQEQPRPQLEIPAPPLPKQRPKEPEPGQTVITIQF